MINKIQFQPLRFCQSEEIRGFTGTPWLAHVSSMTRLNPRHPGIPKALRGWTIVSPALVPRLWGTIWADVLKGSLSDSTRAASLVAVDRLYASATLQLGADRLDAIIAQTDFDTIEQILGGFLTQIRNESIASAVDRETAWQTALSFIIDIMQHIGASAGAAALEIAARCRRLEQLYSQLSPPNQKAPPPIRALPAFVVEELYELFNPTSPRNPFRLASQRWRNQLIFIVLLHLGLRRGELLLLSADPIEHDFDYETGRERYWINVDEKLYEDEDTRQSPPGIKNLLSRRQLPVSSEIITLIDAYLQGYRGRVNHPFLMNSAKMKPLSKQGLSLVFNVVSSKLSDRSLKLLKNQGKDGVTAHDLRHTVAGPMKTPPQADPNRHLRPMISPPPFPKASRTGRRVGSADKADCIALSVAQSME
jgi:integrase